MAAIAFALMSGIDRYDTTLFSVHMVQHILLMLVAAPLIALSAPITLLLRVSSPETRRRWILPILHSRVIRVLAHPVVASLVFAIVHVVGPLHAAVRRGARGPARSTISSTCCSWGARCSSGGRPSRSTRRRSGCAIPARIVYVFLQMTQNTFLAVVILGAGDVLYPHYATRRPALGSDGTRGPEAGRGLMWIAGDLIFIGAILAVLAGWIAVREARSRPRTDRRRPRSVAAIRVRERRLPSGWPRSEASRGP